MKLYFYKLDLIAADKNGRGICVMEREATESKRRYTAPIGGCFPNYHVVINKKDIGIVQYDGFQAMLILEKPNFDYAKEKILETLSIEIKVLEMKIDKFRRAAMAVRESEEIKL